MNEVTLLPLVYAGYKTACTRHVILYLNWPECTIPLYEDSSVDYCYFLLDPELNTRYSSAINLCALYDVQGGTHLAVADTDAKVDFIKDSGLLAEST